MDRRKLRVARLLVIFGVVFAFLAAITIKNRTALVGGDVASTTQVVNQELIDDGYDSLVKASVFLAEGGAVDLVEKSVLKTKIGSKEAIEAAKDLLKEIERFEKDTSKQHKESFKRMKEHLKKEITVAEGRIGNEVKKQNELNEKKKQDIKKAQEKTETISQHIESVVDNPVVEEAIKDEPEIQEAISKLPTKTKPMESKPAYRPKEKTPQVGGDSGKQSQNKPAQTLKGGKNKICLDGQCYSFINTGIEVDSGALQHYIDAGHIATSLNEFNAGDNKTTIFSGHNPGVMAPFRKGLAIGKIVTVYDANGKAHKYQVKDYALLQNNNDNAKYFNSDLRALEVYNWGTNEESIAIQFCENSSAIRQFQYYAVKV